MFSPINIRRMRQGAGAPLIDPCTTVRKFIHDDGSGETHVIYKGYAIFPWWFDGRYLAIAITFKNSVNTFPPPLTVTGVGRDSEHDKCMIAYFNRPPNDDEMRFFHDCMKRWASLSQ